MAPERLKGEIKMLRIHGHWEEREKEKKKEVNSGKDVVRLQSRKWEMFIQKEPRMHIVSICLTSNKFLGYSYDNLFKTAFTFENTDR